MPRIVLVGPYSSNVSPVGGHLQRLKGILDRSGIPTTVLDTDAAARPATNVVPASSVAGQFKTLWALPASLVDFHADRVDVSLAVAILFLSLKHSILVSLHGSTSSVPSFPVALFARMALSRTRVVVAHDAQARERAGRLTWKGRVLVLPEYLPPPEPSSLDRNDLTEVRTKHQCLVVSTAPEVSIRLGGDNHGTSMLIEAAHRLWKEDGIDLAVVFHVDKSGDRSAISGLQERLEELGMADRWQFVEGPTKLLHSLWGAADAFVLAGSARVEPGLLRDALASGVPVVVNDSAGTESGVQTIKNGDTADLHKVLRDVLRDVGKAKERVKGLPLRSIPDRYVKMYRSLERERSG